LKQYFIPTGNILVPLLHSDFI